MAADTAARVLTYGFEPAADVTADGRRRRWASAGMRFRLLLPEAAVGGHDPALGRHSVHNALAAAAVGVAVGSRRRRPSRPACRGTTGAPHRSVLIETATWRILDDSYNAAPDSMAAALDLLAELPGRHVAVLGEMLELGDGAAAAHREVGTRAARRADRLIVVGAGRGRDRRGCPRRGHGPWPPSTSCRTAMPPWTCC